MSYPPTEIEAALERFLDAVRARAHPVLCSAKDLLGLTQLIYESAHRHGIQNHVKLPDWDVFIGNDVWEETIHVYTAAVNIYRPHYSPGGKWRAEIRQNGTTVEVAAVTFPGLFDQIVRAIP